MAMREDAAITTIFRMRMYTFGLWVAFGMLLAVVMLALLLKKKKAGTAALQSVLTISLGLVFSRFLYGITDDTIGQSSPLWVLVRLNLGGYSLYGALGGAILAAWLTAKLSKLSTLRWSAASTILIPPKNTGTANPKRYWERPLKGDAAKLSSLPRFIPTSFITMM